jgi:hypothetical protein
MDTTSRERLAGQVLDKCRFDEQGRRVVDAVQVMEMILSAEKAAYQRGWDAGRVAGRESVLHADTTEPA